MPKKTVVKSKQKSSLFSRFSEKPLALRVLVIVALVLALGLGGTLGYSKYKERELLAQAGAARIGLRSGAHFGNSFALCKRMIGARTYVRGITARKPSTSRSTMTLTTFSPGTRGKAGSVYARSQSSIWWMGVVTFAEAPVAATGWAEVTYAGSRSQTVYVPFVPWC